MEINDVIKYIEHGEDNYKGYAKKFEKNKETKKNRCRFYNQSTLHLYNEKIINIKLFNNGKIQLTGIKDNKCIISTLNILISELIKYKVLSKDTTILNYDVVLINSDFDIGFKINREELYRHILSINMFCTYEPCISWCKYKILF